VGEEEGEAGVSDTGKGQKEVLSLLVRKKISWE
jgi:hypothetical protein